MLKSSTIFSIRTRSSLKQGTSESSDGKAAVVPFVFQSVCIHHLSFLYKIALRDKLQSSNNQDSTWWVVGDRRQ